MDVVIAARICAAAHGEQVVVSRATRDMAGDEPLPGGVVSPARAPSAEGRTRRRTALPARRARACATTSRRSRRSRPRAFRRFTTGSSGEPTRSRASERLLAEADVASSRSPGPGGAGKSRLALEVAAGAARRATRPPRRARPDHRRRSSSRARSRARSACASRAASRVLDADRGPTQRDRVRSSTSTTSSTSPAAAVHVAELLDRAPDLQVLATSRTPLRLSTERVLPLEPLSIDDATTLFVELAAARGVVLQDDALASVHEICRRLDGLPLAIELVAARLVVLPPAEIVRALGEGLALEMEGPVDLPERQRTLRAAIDWSYGRLTDEPARPARRARGVRRRARRSTTRGRSPAPDVDVPARSRGARRLEPGSQRGERRRASASRCSRRSASTRSTTCAPTVSSTSCGTATPSASSTLALEAETRALRARPGALARSSRARARQPPRGARLAASSSGRVEDALRATARSSASGARTAT